MIDEKGVHVKYSGFSGRACFEETKRIYEALKLLGVDVKIEKVTETSEVMETQRTKVVNHA